MQRDAEKEDGRKTWEAHHMNVKADIQVMPLLGKESQRREGIPSCLLPSKRTNFTDTSIVDF